MKKLRILQINKFHFLKGGSERHVFDVSKKLKEAGHEVIHFSMEDSRNIISKRDERKYFIKKIDFNKFSIKNIIKLFYNYDAVKKLETIIGKEKPDIVHLHNFAHHFSTSILSVVKKNKIPMVHTLHDYKMICPNYKLFSRGQICTKCKGGKYYHCVARKCMKNSYLKSLLASLEAYYVRIFKFYDKIDFFIAPSEYMKEQYIKFGYPQDRIKVLYNFIDVPELRDREVMEREDYLLYFGRLSSEKGLDLLIESILKLDNGKMKLKIAGLGPEHGRLLQKIEKLNLNNRVELLGFKTGEELTDFVDNALAIVIPSIWPENMPYSLLEAMAKEKVVIVSRVGGMSELITGENGIVFDSGSSSDFINKINALNKIDRVQMGKKAQKSVLKLSGKNYLEKLLEIYYSL